MSVTPCLVDRWAEENNNIVRKWKEYENRRQPLQDVRKHCYAECLKLQQKIQGLPATTEQLKLEITTSYNTLILSLSYSKPKETQHHLTNSLVRALEAVGAQVSKTDLDTLLQAVLKTFGGTVYQPCIHKLLLIQWAIWLSEGQFESILHLIQQINPKKKITPSGDLLAEIQNLTFSIQEDPFLLVAMAAKDLKDLLHICTFVSKGVEQMRKENYTEALVAFQEAATLSSPRALLAHIHTLTGLCFTKLGQPQSALQCYRKALEVDFSYQRPLYQSSLVYRQLGNSHAEIEALHLLHSAVLLHTERDSSSTPAALISPDMLLGSEQMAFISQVPSPVLILHTLAHRCVLSDRNSEGAEFYLDLLASLQSDSRLHVPMSDALPVPRIPVIYLEAAFAVLKAKRFWDAIAICEEVIAKTADLIPERLLLEPHHHSAGPTELAAVGVESEAVEEKLDCVLWSGAAYFLQGHAYLQLKDTKEALTSFTRAINQLVKVCVKQKYWTVNNLGQTGDSDNKVATLEALKGQTLAGRGMCFVERGQLKEALRDFQLSLQASSGCRNTEMWLVETLWRLDRKKEAAAMWKQNYNSTDSPTPVDLPLYLQTWQENATHLDHSNLNEKMEKFIHSCGDITMT
ncbi:Fanconi anemia group G protein [Colossoma macropomum]|uniref:Fanconi anemia group G protein n=1 Tax=Colossoma macropomum TaxID=42526 RepID=UPI001864D847|nr:Fanconi anemia group G protein [Colossoma macropomum]